RELWLPRMFRRGRW
ncbi:UDP-3-O-(3-hydroxymyristoyl) glucosamine N-acyltransferase, partial [Calderihabitans maritimus]